MTSSGYEKWQRGSAKEWQRGSAKNGSVGLQRMAAWVCKEWQRGSAKNGSMGLRLKFPLLFCYSSSVLSLLSLLVVCPVYYEHRGASGVEQK